MTIIHIDENQTTPIVATTADEWVIDNDITVETSDVGIDALGLADGRQFTINGTLRSTNGPAMTFGDAGLPHSTTIIKVGDHGTFASGGVGLVALSGVRFENVGTVETVGTALDLSGDGNEVKNDGLLRSTRGSAIVMAGDADWFENNATIEAKADAIVSSGLAVSLTNNLNLISTKGRGFVSTGDLAVLTNNSDMQTKADVIFSSGDGAIITNTLTMTSLWGRGLVSTGADASLLNTGKINTKLDGIFSTGDGLAITNNKIIASSDGAAIVSKGDAFEITNTTSLSGMTFGILSSGDDAVITNAKMIKSDGVGIKSTGDHAVINTTDQLIGGTALWIAGEGSLATNLNEIHGKSKIDAAVRITSSHDAAFTNEGVIDAKSGLVIEAGKGAESILNTGSLFGDVRLGAGNDWFSALQGLVTGKVYGGKGNDVYVAGIPLDIREKTGEGHDTVQAVFTWTLGANLENLELLGDEKADATGNKLDNLISGNRAANKLTGLGGSDIFVFATDAGRDTIMDFEDRKDLIDFRDVAGIDSFADIKGHVVEKHGDVIIDLNDTEAGLKLTIRHFDAADLSAKDFLF